VLFATLFSFFHKKTGFRELLPATAAQYFLQAVNILAADGALVIFLNRRKGIRWLTAKWTMMFAGFIDAMTLAGIATVAGLFVPQSKIRLALPYPLQRSAFYYSSRCGGHWAIQRHGRRHGFIIYPALMLFAPPDGANTRPHFNSADDDHRLGIPLLLFNRRFRAEDASGASAGAGPWSAGRQQ
jgi:hypothetical protein